MHISEKLRKPQKANARASIQIFRCNRVLFSVFFGHVFYALFFLDLDLLLSLSFYACNGTGLG